RMQGQILKPVVQAHAQQPQYGIAAPVGQQPAAASKGRASQRNQDKQGKEPANKIKRDRGNQRGHHASDNGIARPHEGRNDQQQRCPRRQPGIHDSQTGSSRKSASSSRARAASFSLTSSTCALRLVVSGPGYMALKALPCMRKSTP